MRINHQIERITDFAFRYIAMNCNSHYEALSRKFELPKIPSGSTHCIFDYDNGEIVLFTSGGNGSFMSTSNNKDLWLKSFVVNKKYKLEFLEKYKTDNKNFILQCDKINPDISEILDVYEIEGIWLAFTYSTGSNKRMIINKNLFGKYQIIGTREFNIEKILLNL